ncbi:preprotein translocase subunit SecE [uncultured Tessaracoccus sp.]|uniref:preprotein translocase subunit SecE n=1 Tax=uncultured Tessaracoccus sp. TaxID=905023 RepID=UPI00262BE734|nr:preprotein translocase subunit SecE [uncultured Tessaracoccus sp.]
MSDKSPEETPSEASLDEPTQTGEPDVDTSAADDKPAADDKVINDLEKDLSADNQASSKPVKRRTAQAPVKKGTATRKRKDAEREHDDVDPYKAKNPKHFVQQSVGELKKVVWPTWPAMVGYFAAVLVFVLFVILYVTVLDGAFGWSLLQILGSKNA